MVWIIVAVVVGVIIGIIAVLESKSSSPTESVQTAHMWTAPNGFFGHWDLFAYVAEFCAMGTEDMRLTVLYSEDGQITLTLYDMESANYLLTYMPQIGQYLQTMTGGIACRYSVTESDCSILDWSPDQFMRSVQANAPHAYLVEADDKGNGTKWIKIGFRKHDISVERLNYSKRYN